MTNLMIVFLTELSKLKLKIKWKQIDMFWMWYVHFKIVLYVINMNKNTKISMCTGTFQIQTNML